MPNAAFVLLLSACTSGFAMLAGAQTNVGGTWDVHFAGTVQETGTSQTDDFVMEIRHDGSGVAGTLRVAGLDPAFPLSGEVSGTTFRYTVTGNLGPACEVSVTGETTVDAATGRLSGSQTQSTCEGTAIGEVTAVRRRSAGTSAETPRIAAPLPATAAQESADAAAIRARIDVYLDAWDAHDASRLATLYTDDADVVMGTAAAAHGPEAIRDLWGAYFAQQEPERHLTLDVSPIHFVADGVAMITVATTTGGRDSRGEELVQRYFRGTWLWRRQGGEWRIAAMRGLPTERDRVTLNASAAAAERLKPDVRAFVASYEDAFNRHDPSAVSAMYRDDAELIVRNSPVMRGRRAIEEWWRTYFAEPRPYRALFVIDEMRAIAPDVVLLNVTGTGYVASSTDERPPLRYARATWIVVRDAGEWRIAALWVLPSEDDVIIRSGS